MSVSSARNRPRRLLTTALGTLFAVSLFPAVGTAQAQDNTTNQAPIEQQLAQPEAFCGPLGLAADDPRANPGALTGEGVDLSIPHVSPAGTEGTYHLFTRDVDFSQPVGVVVRLHGDGGYEYYYPETSVNCQAAVAASHNMILVAPLSPSTSEYGEPKWWYEIPTNVEWVSDLLYTDILPIENVDPNNIWWVGYSGGAEFITYGLVPLAPELITGGAVMFGGGGPPSGLEEGTVRLEELADVPLNWVVGTEDNGTDEYAPWNALNEVQRGAAAFAEQGLDVSLTVMEGRDHFDLPQAALLDSAIEGQVTTPTPAAAAETTPAAETAPAPEQAPEPVPAPAAAAAAAAPQPNTLAGIAAAANLPTSFEVPAEVQSLLGVELDPIALP